jgi:hypothetical protein
MRFQPPVVCLVVCPVPMFRFQNFALHERKTKLQINKRETAQISLKMRSMRVKNDNEKARVMH